MECVKGVNGKTLKAEVANLVYREMGNIMSCDLCLWWTKVKTEKDKRCKSRKVQVVGTMAVSVKR